MYLFSRLATLGGNERSALTWAAEMTSYVNDHSDHNLTLWRTDFGYPVGTVAWSAWADSMDSLNKGFAGLADDDGYYDLLDKGEAFTTDPPQDQLRQAIHGGPGEAPPPLGAVTSITTAVAAGGQYAEAMTWGVEMAQLVQEITGQTSLFMSDVYGTFGQVTWLTGAADMAAVDASTDAIAANAEYLGRLGAVGDLFVPASGHQRLVTRIA
jgi:hypothetical protein